MQWHNTHAGLHRRRVAASGLLHLNDTSPVNLEHLRSTDLSKRQSDSSSSSLSDSSSGSSSGSSDSSSTSSSSGSSSSCVPGDSRPTCQLPTGSGNSNTLAISLGVILPVLIALCAFLYLHRRYKARLRMEDANDKHASLDFGLGEGARRGKKGAKGAQPQNMTEASRDMLRPGRGMSMDMLGSPYILPGEVSRSRSSFQSLSRSVHDGEDPYSPVAFVKRDASPNGTALLHKDSASVFTTSDDRQSESKDGLIGHASKPSKSSPIEIVTEVSPSHDPLHPVTSPIAMPEPVLHVPRKAVSSNTDRLELPGSSTFSPRTSSRTPEIFSTPLQSPLPTSPGSDTAPQVPEKEVVPNLQITTSPPAGKEQKFDEWATYADVLGIVQKESNDPSLIPNGNHSTSALPTIHEPEAGGLGVQDIRGDPRRLSASIRPLPDYDPADTAEQRANRIRSFYREYFDDSKGWNGDRGAPVDYYEDYSQEHLNDATVYDPQTGQFIVAAHAPFAQPVTRRAMTPPPRAPPRFRGQPGPRGPVSSAGSHPRQRAYSSQSVRPEGPRGRPVRRLPPPSPLNNLPSPYLLQTDPGIMSAIEFAPPTSARDRQAGRADSPLLGSRPYAPQVRAFTPISSAFSELPPMPSPHHLRKSGTFTGLDFAPSPRFALGENGSDNGSIRSGRSNLTAFQVANIRAGAYRLSRIPKETVGTKDDLAVTLKPQWDIGR